jgi:Ca2+-binding RTX toxin-like protein
MTGAGAAIVNAGIIKAEWGITVYNGTNDSDPLLAKNATDIVNTGKVAASDHAIYADGVAVNLRNTGMLNGIVSLGGGQDVVSNRGGAINGDVQLHEGDDVFKNRDGTINGDVRLGFGDDRFEGRGGRLNGVLYGGDGNDVVTLASPATLYVEQYDEGFDRVRINATYRLGAHIDGLTLLGKANHTGIGNSLSNWLIGNKGDNALFGLDGGDVLSGNDGRDRLDGGAGNDTLHGGTGKDSLTGGDGDDDFQFIKGDGRDTIADFIAGSDVIEISGFTGIVGFDDLDIDQSGADAVIRFNDTDILVLTDTIGGNLVDTDFVFLLT